MEFLFENDIKAEIGQQNFKINVHWRNGEFLMDEPIANGGQDLGPDPFTMLLSSLGGCTLATLRIYIEMKKWDVKNISIEMNMYKAIGSLNSIIVRKIRFEDSITEDQKERLLIIADKCPISKTLMNPIEIKTSIVE